MQVEFPYQIVTFLGKEPHPKEPVYYGTNGWYPQLALKRRFKLNGINEMELIQSLKKFFKKIDGITIVTGALVNPEQMPVQVIDVVSQDTLKELHARLIKNLANSILSRYPERDGENYYPHITAKYNNEFVIPVDKYTNKDFRLANVWLLKDTSNNNSLAFVKIK